MSLKLVPFDSLSAVSYSPSIVTMAVSVAVCEIFSVKDWCDLENRVRFLSASRRRRITATSSLRCPAAPGRTASPAQLLWPTGFLCGWSVGLEFFAGQLA